MTRLTARIEGYLRLIQLRGDLCRVCLQFYFIMPPFLQLNCSSFSSDFSLRTRLLRFRMCSSQIVLVLCSFMIENYLFISLKNFEVIVHKSNRKQSQLMYYIVPKKHTLRVCTKFSTVCKPYIVAKLTMEKQLLTADKSCDQLFMLHERRGYYVELNCECHEEGRIYS